MEPTRAWGLALAAGAGAAGLVVGVLDATPLLGSAVGASVAAVVRLSALHPDTVLEEGTAAWTVGRWSGLAIGFLLAVTLFGTVGLPVDERTRLAVRVLLFGAGYAMWLLGVAYARAKAADPG